MKKLVFRINGGVVRKCSSKENLIKFLKEEFGVERFDVQDMNDDEFDLSVEECVDMLLEKEELICWNEELCERGDDYCEMELEEY
jgi:hypothetical protein